MPADLSLPARLAEALRRAPSLLMDSPEERARHAESERNHHVGHHYYWGCAVCRGEVDTLAEVAAAVVQAELDRAQQRAVVAEARLKRVRDLADAVLRSGDTGAHLLAQSFLRLVDAPVLVPTAALGAAPTPAGEPDA